MKIHEIYRYPVKGFTGESLAVVELEAGGLIPFDRNFAITHRSSDYNHTDGGWTDRRNFVVLAHSPLLGSLSLVCDMNRGTITFKTLAGEELVIDIDSAEADGFVSEFIFRYASVSQPGPYRLVRPKNVSLTDSPTKTISIMNIQSLIDMEKRTGWQIDKARFRGNLWLDGCEPWEERNWVGRMLRVGNVELRVTEEIIRCAAVDASPENGTRDLSVLSAINTQYGHVNFGVLAEVVTGGTLSTGSLVT